MSEEVQPKPLDVFIVLKGTLLGLPFEASAQRVAGQPLVFEGTLLDDQPVDLLDMADALFPGEVELPPGLPRLQLSAFAFSFTPDTGEFSIRGQADLALGQRFSLFGVNFSLPDGVAFEVELARREEDGVLVTTLVVGLSLAANQALTISSGLAWLRPLGESLFREVQNDEANRAQDLVRLELSSAQAFTMTLLRTTLGDPTSTAYLANLAVDGAPADLELDLELVIDVGAVGKFVFPFLKQEAVTDLAGILEQQISLPDVYTLSQTLVVPAPGPELGAPRGLVPPLSLDVPIKMTFDKLQFLGNIPIRFDLSRFALGIDHEQGIHLLTDQSKLEETILGLTWAFKGAPAGEDKYHLFTLVTKDFNYQLQLAPGASLELSYREISKEPIVFRVTEFVIGSKGLTLTAGIADDPVRLNGLDTKFRFEGSQLRIVENRIQDLTIAGTGALPPDLVGDAVADIALQFKQVNGGLRLISGAAQLRGEKPLDCRGTRFQFSIDAMGLKFVYDQKFHLYFTLTGKARFVPAASDDKDGPLALLPNIEMELVECPLTGDASVIAKHINFLVEFPKPVSFSFLGAYGFELRAIGFQPQSEKFGGRGAMILSGQVLFAQGKGDQVDPKPDFHKLYIGLPPKGKTVPQVDMGTLPVGIKAGEKFKLSGSVSFKFTDTMQGFTGDGVLEIAGLPPMAAAFGFMRVRRDADAPWVRAWFIYLEVRQVSFQVPVLQFYIREVGLGFGYRFTIVAIKAADEAGDIKQLIRELKVLSRTQGDLSKQDRWAVDLEKPGQDPRWTIVLRAMISQLSAAPSPLTWDATKERKLANVYLFDAIIAVRSDLTFFMSVRGWLNTNYWSFVEARNANESLAPLVSGFVLLSVRQKRFLAHLASNPQGHLGTEKYPLIPPLPPFLVRSLRNIEVSATLLIEPGLMHFELGWPNMLRWSDSLGPLSAELRGGFIFRISSTELLIGISLLARARLEISASINLGLVGASLSALAEAAYGARYMALIPFDGRPLALYGAIGLEIQIQISLSLWIKIPLIFTTIKLSFSFSFSIGFTAGLEVGLYGTEPGLRGRGTISLSIMGHSLHFSVDLSANAGAVASARQATERYLQVGLEATDVETTLPGVDSAPEALPVRALAMTARDMAGFHAPQYSVFAIRDAAADGFSYFVLLPRGQKEDGRPEEGFLPVPPAQANDWTDDAYHDFHLDLPAAIEGLQRFDPHGNGAQGAWADVGGSEVTWKARWDQDISQVDEAYSFTDPYDESQGQPEQQDDPEITSLTLRQYLRQAFLVQNGNGANAGDPPPGPDDVVNTGDPLDDVVPIGDPAPVYSQIEQLEDERVQNPSDSAFEAAVRGAVEQFRGSPFFKHDPNLAYDRALEDAFRPDTTIYTEEGTVPGNEDGRAEMEGSQQAHQIRGLVIHKLVDDLREYVVAGNGGGQNGDQDKLAASSIPFQMGLVFRVPAGQTPPWLRELPTGPDAAGQQPTIQQRLRPEDTAPTSSDLSVETFNLSWTDFSINPPQFQRLQHFTDANTIAIAWDLAWEDLSSDDARTQPEHHLQYYRVRRRPLDGRTPEVVYQVKNAAVLQREPGGLLKSLKPRFQVIDHFNQETLEQQVSLPPTGRSYLYTITPVDSAGKVGQPLTLVATRYPNEPPRVPVDGELLVEYQLPLAEAATLAPVPQVVEPAGLQVTWSEPSGPKDGPRVAIDDYCLVFRREATLPIGSYGLDSSTQRARTGLLPTSNARALPTDVRVVLVPSGPRGKRVATQARLSSEGPDAEARPLLAVLRQAGVFPQAPEDAWRPESWRIFFQTVSSNQVPSALAPVQLLLRARSGDPEATGVEERRPAELEWLPRPLQLPMLPPHDGRSVTGTAHLPMPAPGDLRFHATLGNVEHQTHPLGLRCIRFRWNQGPSDQPDYPLNLTAGYDLLELDVDAHTEETYKDAELLAGALRRIQEVQMLPAEDLWLVPGDTLETNQWEAWYPSATIRRAAPDTPVEGTESKLGPWHSWRESLLEWPAWPGLTDQPGSVVRAARPGALDPASQEIVRPGALHPALEDAVIALARLFRFEYGDSLGDGALPDDLVRQLAAKGMPTVDAEQWTLQEEEADSGDWAVRYALGSLVCRIVERNGHLYVLPQEDYAADVIADYTLDVQTSPPFQPQDWAGFLQSTDPESDPYGWGVLQRFGLSLAFGLRQAADGQLVVADDLLALLDVILAYMARQSPDSLKYLHAELLFQPGRRVELSQTPASADALLGFAQLSLRPAISQVQKYRRVEVRGKPGQQVYLTLTFSQPFSLIDQADPASGQVELEPDAAGEAKTVKRAITLPAEGLTNLLLRGGELPTVALDPDPDKADDNEGALVSAPHDFAPTHPLSTYFSQSVEALAAAFLSGDAQDQWQRFRRYAEALTPLPNQAPFVQVETDQAGLEEQLPAFLAWAQRFFDHSAPVEPAGNGLARTGAGPWLATAYPRVTTPALVAPDAGGRLTYDHLLQDRWAHDYRYYVRPYDRYRLLWQSLYQSSNLFPGGAPVVEELAEARPDPEAGGVDVVLDRTQPVDMPLVLNSARLDPPGEPGQPVPPGTTWEVIVARHAEQSLVERNQTLARQLAFRQVAFTLLRRFAYEGWVTDHDWVTDLENAVVSQGGAEAHKIDLLWVENALPDALPEGYPEQPDHVVFEPGQPLPDELARSLDLPQRIGSFQQGALVLQWEGLPFFYEHRLLLVAQTASTVSPVNEVTQRDFEYRSPDLFEADRFPSWQATVEGEEMPLLKEDGPVDGVLTHGRALALPLHRFWDCLPTEAQARWPAEAPVPEDEGGRKPASLPDPEVIYQIVEVVDGNIEVQAEIYFDKEKMQYARRQLGQRILVDETLILAPPAAPQADYVLHLALGQKNVVPLEGTMQPVGGPTAAKIKHETGKLTVYGVLTAADRDVLKEALGDDRDRDKIETLYRGWTCREPVSGPVDLDQLPQEFDGLKERLDFQKDGEASLIRHHGIMLPAEAQALKALFESPEDQDAIERLYACGVSKGLYGGEIKIMARRGGAAPSEMRPLEAQPLE